MTEQNQIPKWRTVGIVEIAPSGKSLRIIIHDDPDTVFEKRYYVGREAVTQVNTGHKKSCTVYILEE